MPVPRLISFPTIDQDALEQEIAGYKTSADTGLSQVQSRSQAMLDDAITKGAWLEEELKTVRAGRSRLDANLTELSHVRDSMKVTEDDISVELNAVNQIITLLKAAGVSL